MMQIVGKYIPDVMGDVWSTADIDRGEKDMLYWLSIGLFVAVPSNIYPHTMFWRRKVR